MIHVLLADFKEVLATREVIKHDDTSDFVEQLLLEVLTLVKQFLYLLGPLRQHQVFRLLVVIPHFVELLDESGILNFPLFIILLFEQLVLLLFKKFLSPNKLEFRALNQKECLLETCTALLSLILELCVQRVIDHETLMNWQLTSHAYHITDSLVQIAELRYLCLLQHKLLKVIKFSTQTKILISKLFSVNFNLLAPFWNLIVDALILGIESIKILCKLFCHVWGFTKHLTRQGLYLLDSSWSSWLFFYWQVVPKLVLILLSKEIHQELTTTQHFWFHHTRHEFLIIYLLLGKLLARQLLLLVD